jgi:predicted TIM-barrel fold metal-dependent hydrolase
MQQNAGAGRPPVIDFHMHLFPHAAAGRRRKAGYEIWEYGTQPTVVESSDDGTAEQAVAALDRGGLDFGVIANLYEVEYREADLGDDGLRPDDESVAGSLERFNLWACEAAAEHPRLIPFIAVDPVAMDPPATIEHVRRMHRDHGAKGIKIHPVLQGLDPTDRAWWPVFETCAELGLIVLSHSGPARPGGISAEPTAFASLVGHLPGLSLVLAHAGGGAWRSTPQAANELPGVWFDVCEIIERTGSTVGPTLDELGALIATIGPERVIFGSDFPWYEPAHSLEVLRSLPGLTSHEIDAVAGGNAARLLGL